MFIIMLFSTLMKGTSVGIGASLIGSNYNSLPLYSLQASNRVMDLDHVDGRLKIQYSDRLVSLVREVRQLSALGFPIPAKIQQAANTADKFYRQAIVLKQVRVYTKTHKHVFLMFLFISVSLFLF